MNHENTIIYLSSRLAEVEAQLKVQTNDKEYWYKAWKDASERAADLQLIIDNSAPAKEGDDLSASQS